MQAYLLLTRSKTIVSRIVHIITGDEYTHASIVVHDACYSFTRLNRFFILPAGFTKESATKGFQVPYAVYTFELKKDPLEFQGWKFDILRLFGCKRRERHCCCSDFAYACITGAFPNRRIRPMELAQLPGVTYLSKGTLGTFGGEMSWQEIIHNKFRAIYN